MRVSSEEQRIAFNKIISSRDLVTLFRGGAGTGKSHVLRHVQAALEMGGRHTLVLAPQRQQVLDLEKDGLVSAAKRWRSFWPTNRCRSARF